MGRQDYLIRLALGRSAFQELDDGEDMPELGPEDAVPALVDGTTLAGQHGGYKQQYDSKGRPINLATEARNAEMRRAQNSVLALVGVVEKRERVEQHNEMKFRHIGEARQAVLEKEHERGEKLDSVLDLGASLCVWWADCIFHRCVLGLYDTRTPFTEILLSEWQSLRYGGLKGVYSTLFPGAVALLTHLAARACLHTVIEEGINRLSVQTWMISRRRKTQARINIAMRCVTAGLWLVCDMAVLPLLYYGGAQQLGLAPAIPLLPPLKFLLPWQHPDSFHHFGWAPFIGLPLLRSLCSPAALLLTEQAPDYITYEEEPQSRLLTSFQYPPLELTSVELDQPTPLWDPLSWILHYTYSLRVGVLQWCGWNMTPPTYRKNTPGYEKDSTLTLDDDGKIVARTHRSTTMARLPAQVLASHLDGLLEKLVILPFWCLTARAIAMSYMHSSTLPKTLQGLQAAPMLRAPFDGWLVNSFRSPASATEFAYYASKVGLSLALRVSIGAVISIVVTKMVCRIGERDFDWGSRGRIGGIVYGASRKSRSASR